MIVEKLLNNGSGLARFEDGRVLFVPGALAGDEIESLESEMRKGVGWAKRWILKQGSPERVQPECPHFEACGGCALLHLKRESELEQKKGYFLDTLTRIAKVAQPAIVGVDFSWRQSRVRGKLHVDGNGLIGFKQQAGSKIEPISGCQVIPASVVACLPYWSDLLKRANFLGVFFFSTDESGLNPSFEFQLSPGWQAKIGGLMGALPEQIKGVCLWDPERPSSRKVFGDPRQSYRWAFAEVSLEPSQFLQSNPATWPHFWRFIREWKESRQLQNIWDAHAGSGFLGVAMATAALLVSEPDPRANRVLELMKDTHALNWRLWQGTAESLLQERTDWLRELDAVVLDPPRTGLEGPLIQWLISRGPSDLLYVSCDMGSFARDWKQLQRSYELDGPILLLNPNPGTLKLESLARMKRIKKD